MVIIKVGNEEFSIEEDILRDNINFIVSLNLKNKDMMVDFDYSDHNDNIFKNFIIPLLKNELTRKNIEDNVIQMINKNCIDSYWDLLALNEMFNEIENEFNFFGFDVIESFLTINENIKNFVIVKHELMKIVNDIECLIIKINYSNDILFDEKKMLIPLLQLK